MNEEFRYLITPAASDIKVSLSDLNNIASIQVYGSPGQENPPQGVLCEISSLFPSLKESKDMTKGGVVVSKLTTKESSSGPFTLRVHTTYMDPNSTPQQQDQDITFPKVESGEFYGDEAIHKALLLTRYVTFAKTFLREAHDKPDAAEQRKLYSDKYRTFHAYFRQEAEKLGDERLIKELGLLQDLFEVKTQP